MGKTEKRIKKKATDLAPEEAAAAIELASKEEYQEYIREHSKRLRRLQREAMGYNMEEPDYD